MSGLIVLVHTGSPLIAEFNRLCAGLLPDTVVKHLLDEPLLERVQRRRRLAPEDADRLKDHVRLH